MSNNLVEFLIKSGAAINQQNNEGFTALHFAVLYGNTEYEKMLLEAGADPNIKTNGGLIAEDLRNLVSKQELDQYEDLDAKHLLCKKLNEAHASTRGIIKRIQSQ